MDANFDAIIVGGGLAGLNCARHLNNAGWHCQLIEASDQFGGRLFALLLRVDPKRVHQWYLAVYVDAVEWVELPNSLGISQFADGGVMASKPYVATGKYIQRVSNYCGECRFDPAKSVGKDTCPFTTLYWDFLVRHKKQLGSNHRMSMQLRNLDRKQPQELKAIQKQAEALRASFR